MNCPQCESPQVAKMGRSSIGAQRYICRNKGCSVKTFSFPYTYRGANPSVKTQALDMAMNGGGIRDTARVLKIDPNTVMAQIKKTSALTQVNESVLHQHPPETMDVHFHKVEFSEIDAMWSFAQTKNSADGYGMLSIIKVEKCSRMSLAEEKMLFLKN